MTWHWLPLFLPIDPWSRAILGVGALVLVVGSLAWLAGCTRLAARGDRLSAAVLAGAGGVLVAGALVGRPAQAIAYSPAWVGYTLAFVGRVFHADMHWIIDDGFVWMAVGAGLALAGLALITLPGVRPPGARP